jgi:hypothetical protein
MRKIRAIIYAVMGAMMCWNLFQRDYYIVSISIGLFTLCAIGITLAAIGTRKITWDEKGITINQFPSSTRFIAWSELEKIRADHLGYHVRATSSKFKISTKNMPEALLEQIRSSIKANKR